MNRGMIQARVDAGLSLRDLADRLGVSAVVLGDWERAVTEPDWRAVSDALNVPVQVLRREPKLCLLCRHWQPDDNRLWGDCGLTHLASGANQGRFCAVFEVIS